MVTQWLELVLLCVITPCCIAQGSFSRPPAFRISFGIADDLTHFVTRPEIKSPLFNVSIHDAEAVSPGYWFVAPYVSLVGDKLDEHYYQPCQVGPMIYDHNGELVWSGACLLKNQNACDFRAWKADGKDYLSAILFMQTNTGAEKASAVIFNSFLQIDSTYELPRSWTSAGAQVGLNMHEFNPITNDQGETTVLHMIRRSIEVDITGIKHNIDKDVGRVVDNGFAEVDLKTKKVLFEWWASDHIPLSASSGVVSSLTQIEPRGWNWIHLNSIEKSDSGDYLVSARYTDAIYKISGKDGSIIWTLGGTRSNFELKDDFNFSRQHDARFIHDAELKLTTGAKEIISFLDNGADDHGETSSSSSGVLVALTEVPARGKGLAVLIKRWTRPNGELTRQRGNFQIMQGWNAFAGWSGNGHISEFDGNGRLLMETRWKSPRFSTYRAWKFNFTGNPIEPPAMKAFVYGLDRATSTSVAYVSWNGATEVAFWNFYAVDMSGGKTLIGKQQRTGFETMFQAAGCQKAIYAEAVAKDGSVLGKSSAVAVEDSGRTCEKGWPEDLAPEPSEVGARRPTFYGFDVLQMLWILGLASVLSIAWRYIRRRRR